MVLEIGDIYQIQGTSILCIAISETSLVTKLVDALELFYIDASQFRLVHREERTVLDLMRNWGVTSKEFDSLIGATLRQIIKSQTSPGQIPGVTLDTRKLKEVISPKKTKEIKKQSIKRGIRKRTSPKEVEKKGELTEEQTEALLLEHYRPALINDIIQRYQGIPSPDAPRATQVSFILALIEIGTNLPHIASLMGIKVERLRHLLRKEKHYLRPKVTKKHLTDLDAEIIDALPRLASGQIGISNLAKTLGTSKERVRRIMEENHISQPAQRYPTRKPRAHIIQKLNQVLAQMKAGVPLFKACHVAEVKYETIKALLGRMDRQGYPVWRLLSEGHPFRRNPCPGCGRWMSDTSLTL